MHEDIRLLEFDTLEDRLYELLDSSNKHNTKSEFVKDIINLNGELCKYGYKQIEYWNNCSDDEIISYIVDYENEYLENGEMF